VTSECNGAGSPAGGSLHALRSFGGGPSPAELQEQLGVQLDAVTVPINVILMDAVQQPTIEGKSAAESSADVQAGSEHLAVRTIVLENARRVAGDIAGD